MRRLFPHPADDVDLRAAYDVERPAPPDRPWVSLCMVSSLDGSTVVDSTSRGLSNRTDQALLLTLRSFADTILVGAATVRHEHYGPPKLPGQRIAVISRSAQFDFTTPLFTSGQVIIVLPEDAPAVPVPSVRAGQGALDLAQAVRLLHREFGARIVQAEGGGTINGLLATADLVDELNLTISPQLSGG
ncbi:MAG: dihydrofolate reductase family protein, partial [Actinomycetota bacterium]